MKTQAAVLVDLGKPLVVAELEVPALKNGQVLVEVAISGVCHTQLLECRGHRGEDRFLPHCLGHEGSGTVVDVAPTVSKVKPGDRVILSWMKGTGADVPGTVYRWNGRQVNAGGITTFGRNIIVSENRVTKMPPALSFDQAAILGCALATGAGAVFNTAQTRPGQSIAVLGVGGVGLCAIAAAAASGCFPIVAIDINARKLERACQMGATHTLLAGKEDIQVTLREICPSGLDFAIEASGRPEVMAQALTLVRNQGGTAVVIGNARHAERLSIDPRELNNGKRMLGTWGGDNIPDRDFPRYGTLLSAGRFDLSPLMSPAYSLSQINEAIDDLENGLVARPLIDMSAV